ncbi:MAG: hypothetical protein ACQESB_03495 [Elusimicrobiota bacterium]
MGITGCDDGPTREKLLGPILYSPTNETAGQMAAYSTIMIASMGDYADGGDLIEDGTFSAFSEASYTLPEVEGPDEDGWFTVKLEPDTFYVRWKDNNGDVIAEAGQSTDVENLSVTVTEADRSAKYFDIKGDFREIEAPEHAPELVNVDIVENKPDFEFELNETGDITLTKAGAIANGKWRSSFSGGGYSEFEAVDAVIDTIPLDNGVKWIVAGGQGTLETIIADITYTSEITFNSDGTGEGTMTAPNYEAVLFIDTSWGGGYYKDDTGKHEF